MTGRHLFLMFVISCGFWYLFPIAGIVVAILFICLVYRWSKNEDKRMDEAAKEDIRRHRKRMRDFRRGVINIPDSLKED